jgi:putative transposase
MRWRSALSAAPPWQGTGELVAAVLERALGAELTVHLGYGKGDRAGRPGNSRNGSIAKTVQTGVGTT